MNLTFGNNAFRGRFDWYEWSAPEYRGAEEILRAVRKLAGTGKRLAGVRVIGAACNMTCSALESYEYEHAVSAGTAHSEAAIREYLRHLMIPRTVRLCEPFVLDFEDGTSLEFHPGRDLSARISVNAVPRHCMEGLNTPNFDADRLFGQYVRGRKLQDFFLAEKKETVTSCRLSGDELDSKTHSDIEYRYVFRFSDRIDLMVGTTSGGGYRLALAGSMEEFRMPYLKFRATARSVYQPFLCHGVCGEDRFFWCTARSRSREAAQECPTPFHFPWMRKCWTAMRTRFLKNGMTRRSTSVILTTRKTALSGTEATATAEKTYRPYCAI